MTDFEKYQASTEARRASHAEHIDKLTGYFLAETNRLGEHEEPPAQQDATPQPVTEPPPAKRVQWFRWRTHH
jgi:hypothetical protein